MPSKESLKLYTVDGEKVIAETLAITLGNHSHSAKADTKPIDALRASFGASPDLLLSAISLAKMDGVQLAKAVRENCPSCMVILFGGEPLLLSTIAGRVEISQPMPTYD